MAISTPSAETRSDNKRAGLCQMAMKPPARMATRATAVSAVAPAPELVTTSSVWVEVTPLYSSINVAADPPGSKPLNRDWMPFPAILEISTQIRQIR